jgi:hypothetical protein
MNTRTPNPAAMVRKPVTIVGPLPRRSAMDALRGDTAMITNVMGRIATPAASGE